MDHLIKEWHVSHCVKVAKWLSKLNQMPATARKTCVCTCECVDMHAFIDDWVHK